MRIYLLILFSFLLGCCTLSSGTKTSIEEVDCINAPRVWWGDKGVNPSENKVWKCYNWILKDKELEVE